MRIRGLLAAFLLGVGLCFVPVLGYGEIPGRLIEGKVDAWLDSRVSLLDFFLLEARVNYIMYNPTSFLNVFIDYDPDGKKFGKFFPEGADTKGKICLMVIDNRGVFSDKSGIALLGQFKKSLRVIYSFIEPMTTDMDTDIVAKFLSKDEKGGELGYFYQGEYHLWEK